MRSLFFQWKMMKGVPFCSVVLLFIMVQGMWSTVRALFRNGSAFVIQGNHPLAKQGIRNPSPRRYVFHLAQPSVGDGHDNGMVSWLKGGDETTIHQGDAYALRQIYETIGRVWEDHKSSNHTSLLDLDVHRLPQGERREAVGVARRLQMRLNSLYKNNDCPRCWLQRTHCICSQCPTYTENQILPKVDRLFVLVHHKEIGLTVDTAKLLYMAFPHTQCHIVVNGIGPQYQPSMAQLLDCLQLPNNNDNEDKNPCFILFPTPDAQTFSQLTIGKQDDVSLSQSTANDERKWDVIVMDGTWSQANKMVSRYIPDHVPRVCLSEEAVQILGNQNEGHQLRRHVIPWRQVSTLEATRLLFRDMHPEWKTTDTPWDILATYQSIANHAAKKQLGPPRIS